MYILSWSQCLCNGLFIPLIMADLLLPLQGIPLHLQIDTYEDLTNPDAEPVHRSFCQIKVFRDKVSKSWLILNLHVCTVVPAIKQVIWQFSFFFFLKSPYFLFPRVQKERTKMNPRVQKKEFRNGWSRIHHLVLVSTVLNMFHAFCEAVAVTQSWT